MESNDLKEKILADIQKTGFVTELHIVRILEDHGWSVTHSSTYVDRDENISREIDIKVYKTEKIEDNLRFTFQLFIESKKSDRPWVIFSTSNKMRSGWRIMHSGSNYRTKFGNTHLNMFSVHMSEDSNPRGIFNRVGKAFHEMGKGPTEKSTIYAAVMSATKAAHHFKEAENEDQLHLFNPSDRTEISIYIPVVIVNGRLFEAYNSVSKEIAVDEVNHIPVELHYSSPKYSKSVYGVTYFPEVITFDYLPEFLKKIEEWRIQLSIDFRKDYLKAEEEFRVNET
jgi:hypothetical protein